MKKSAMIGLCSAVFLTGCSAPSADIPDSSAVTELSAVQITAETSAFTTISETAALTEQTTAAVSSALSSVTLQTTTAATVSFASSSVTTNTTEAFQAAHSVTFSPCDLDTVQLKEGSVSGQREQYISYLLENGAEIPVYVGDIAVDREKNCVYAVAFYDWCVLDIPYWGDVAVFRIDEATGEIVQCCRDNISRLGKKNGFSLLNYCGKNFLFSYLGVYLVDEANKVFLPLEPAYNPQVSSVYTGENRLVVQVPVRDEEQSEIRLVYSEFDFETNTMHEMPFTEEDRQKLTAYNPFAGEGTHISYEYQFPDNFFSITRIKVEW